MSVALKLQGQFKFDLYGSDKKLIKSSEYVDNFITNSGVMYPYHFAFADCFRFLSVGNGTTENSIESKNGHVPTTGLSSFIPQFSYIGGRPAWDSGKDESFYARPGDFGAGCGYVNNPNGVSLIRQWLLPDNTGSFQEQQTFREFMVSPGRPFVTGENGVKFCCSDEFDDFATGKDCSSTAEYYRWLSNKYQTVNDAFRLKMCNATVAFARVLQDITVNPGESLSVTYKLNVVLDTGIRFSSLFYNGGQTDNWNYYLQSFNSIVHPGVKLINNGIVSNPTAPNGSLRLQHFDYTVEKTHPYKFENEYGESFIGPFGAPLEPSNFFLANDPNNQNIEIYLSDDNLQFLVNASGGKFNDLSTHAPWNFWQSGDIEKTFQFGDIVSSGDYSYRYFNQEPSSGNFLTGIDYWENLFYLKVITGFTSGVMPFRNDNDKAILNAGYWFENPNSYNTRKTKGYYPDTGDVTKELEMAANSFKATKAAKPSFIFNCPDTGTRNASVSYSYNFENYRRENPMKARSMVAAYKDIALGTSLGYGGDMSNVVPFFDVIFSETGLDVVVPNTITGSDIVNNETGAIIVQPNIEKYHTLYGYTNAIYPILNMSLSWSVPCPNGVNGCN